MSLLFCNNKMCHLVGGIAEDLTELDRGGGNGLTVRPDGHMDLHHHLGVVEKFEEVVFKLDLDEIMLNLFTQARMSSPCSMSLSQRLPQARPSLGCTTDEKIKLD